MPDSPQVPQPQGRLGREVAADPLLSRIVGIYENNAFDCDDRSQSFWAHRGLGRFPSN
jgi:hypothetical protein